MSRPRKAKIHALQAKTSSHSQVWTPTLHRPRPKFTKIGLFIDFLRKMGKGPRPMKVVNLLWLSTENQFSKFRGWWGSELCRNMPPKKCTCDLCSKPTTRVYFNYSALQHMRPNEMKASRVICFMFDVGAVFLEEWIQKALSVTEDTRKVRKARQSAGPKRGSLKSAGKPQKSATSLPMFHFMTHCHDMEHPLQPAPRDHNHDPDAASAPHSV